MMPTLNPKNLVSGASEIRRTSRPASRPGIIPCLIASVLIAVPLPAFADKGDLPSAFDSIPNPNAMNIRFLTRDALAAAAGDNGRFSLHDRMKVK